MSEKENNTMILDYSNNILETIHTFFNNINYKSSIVQASIIICFSYILSKIIEIFNININL